MLLDLTSDELRLIKNAIENGFAMHVFHETSDKKAQHIIDLIEAIKASCGD